MKTGQNLKTLEEKKDKMKSRGIVYLSAGKCISTYMLMLGKDELDFKTLQKWGEWVDSNLKGDKHPCCSLVSLEDIIKYNRFSKEKLFDIDERKKIIAKKQGVTNSVLCENEMASVNPELLGSIANCSTEFLKKYNQNYNYDDFEK